MANINKRTASDGSVSYQVRVRLKGFKEQAATFERLTDAKRWVQDTEAAIRDGRHFKTTEAKRHTLGEVVATEWSHPYGREEAAFPAPWTREHKFWPTVGRIDGVAGDRHLICTCPPVESLASAAV